MKIKNALTRDKIFLAMIKEAGLPEPIPEFIFHKVRKWRFDFAYVEQKIAIEVEGGIWNIGRHNRPKSMIADMEKYNEAAVYGWRLLRVTPEQLIKKTTIDTIKRIFTGEIVEYSIEQKMF